MVDYTFVIGTLLPDVNVVCRGDPSIYVDLEFISPAPHPTELELKTLFGQWLKEDKIKRLSTECSYLILDGFLSDALGVMRKYDADPLDQINILGTTLRASPTPSAPSGTTGLFKVRDVIDAENKVYGVGYYVEHTYDQLRHVIEDGASFKLSLLIKFNNARTVIINKDDLDYDGIEAVTLDDVPV